MSSNNKFNFCPKCGSKDTIQYIIKYWKCTNNNCDFILYHNAASAAGLILSDNNNNVLFEIRAKDPGKGMLGCVGGFTDSDETAEQNAIRECKEEIGVEPINLEYLCSEPNDYHYKGFDYKTCDVYFTAKLPGDGNLKDIVKIDETEVKGLCYKKIETQKDIDELPIAFSSFRNALSVWVKKYGKK